MESSIDLWLEYILRFSHLVAGITWIGSSFYFIWLDSSFLPPESPRPHVDGEVFMVHGGFYYQVEKKKIYPGEIPKILHWFKWEATLTWITGFLLLIYLYFLNDASLLVDPRLMAWSQSQAIALALGLLGGSWLVYDLIWNSRIVKSSAISTFLSAIFFTALVYTSTRLFSGRGAFILVGAILGSLMLLNVWIRILPGQKKMLREALAGEIPDYSVSLKAKVRSVHNTYFIFPVLFIMLSNHYPAVYNHEHSWLVLIVLAISGALVRHAMVSKNSIGRWTLAPAVLGFITLVLMTTAKTNNDSLSPSQNKINDVQAMAIFQTRCLHCHSTTNTDEVFTVAPKGVIFENREQILNYKDKILLHVVTARTMPFLNKTGMTDKEREIIHQWLTQTHEYD